MKTYKLLKTVFLLMSFVVSAQNLSVMSYNIRYQNSHDKENVWDLRKEDLVHQIKFYSPEVLGLQEVLTSQLKFINNKLQDYAFVGVGREDGKDKGEFAPIFYNTNKFILLNSGTFWLSETPTKVSIGWDAALERICTYAVLQYKENGKKLMVFNTHFDHMGEKARLNAAKLIIAKINSFNTEKLPVIFMGDLNSTPNTEQVNYLQHHLADTFAASQLPHYGYMGTFNDFNVISPVEKRIDYIFTKGFKVLKHAHLSEKRTNGLWRSDHLAVFTQLSFR